MSNKTVVVDARGLSCPQPVILAKEALSQGDGLFEIIVDNATARENVTRFAEHSGFSVSATEEGGDYHLKLKK